ncbi:MAG: MMPL family transporter [Alphaproteobacteria bacterium]|nr:MMPL family transporter [Alphaproteobacteria bacterium]
MSAFPLRLLSASLRWIHRHALVVTLIFGVLVVAGGYIAATRLSIRTDTNGMLSPDLPFQRLGLEMTAAFPHLKDTLLVVVDGDTPDLADDAALALAKALRGLPALFPVVQDIEGDPFFRTNGLLYDDAQNLERLSDRLAKAQPFLVSLWQDPSLRGLIHLLGMALEAERKGLIGEGMTVTPVLESLAEIAEAQALGQFKTLSWRNMMSGAEASKKGRRFILLAPAVDHGSLSPGKAAMNKVRELAKNLQLTPERGVRVRLTGSVALSQEELKSVEEGMGWANLAALLMVIGLLVVGLRNFRLVSAVLMTLSAGLILASAYAALAVDRLNLISVAFAVLFIGIGVDFGIHFALRFREARERGDMPPDALVWAAGTVGGPLTLCAVTAAIGFFSFLPTDYLGLAELGHIAGVSMFIALICNLTLLPALLTLMKPRLSPQSARSQPTRGLALGHPKLIASLAALLAIGGAAFFPKVSFDFDPLRLKDPKTESVSTLFDIAEKPRSGPYGITILAADLDQARILAARLREVPVVAEASSIADYIAKDQEEKLDIISTMGLFLTPLLSDARTPPPTEGETRAAFQDFLDQLSLSQSPASRRLKNALLRLPDTSDARADFESRAVGGVLARLQDLRRSLNAQAFTIEDLPEDLRRNEIAKDGRVKVKAYPKGDMKDPLALTQFVEAVRAVAPDASGGPITIYEASQAVLKAFREATLITLAALLVLMALLLQRLREVALIFAPLFLSALLLLPVSVLGGLPFNFANVIVLPLLFGLGIANGIQFVFRERLEKDTAQVLSTTTPRAVIFSALTTMVSFGSLAVSSHPGTANMGILLAIMLTLVLGATLFVLPALMLLWKRRD